jgi:hypothetical protein
MKAFAFVFLCLTFSCSTLAKNPKQKPNRAENAKVVLGNLFKMIGSIGNIIENPRDAEHVGNHVSDMVNNVIAITVNAVENRSINLADAHDVIEELYSTCEEAHPEIAQKIMVIKRDKLHLIA